MSKVAANERITTKFNIWVAVFLSVVGVIRFLVVSGGNLRPEVVLVSAIFDSVRWLAILFIGAKILQEFWNRFVADISELRAIHYREAVAILLVACLLFNT